MTLRGGYKGAPVEIIINVITSANNAEFSCDQDCKKKCETDCKDNRRWSPTVVLFLYDPSLLQLAQLSSAALLTLYTTTLRHLTEWIRASFGRLADSGSSAKM
jgi:hypothetical protein